MNTAINESNLNVTHMIAVDLQEMNEHRYSRKHINGYIGKVIDETPELLSKVEQGVELLTTWIEQDYYTSKRERLDQLDPLNLTQMVRDVFINIAYYQVPELFVSVSSQLSQRMGFSNHRDSILTMAEVIGVLCYTDAFDISKANAQASMMVVNRIPLPRKLEEAIARSMFLPPMVCHPLEVTSNFESPYLTFNDCQILGSHNSHGGDICLDVINTQNAIPLQLAVDFLSSVEEVPNKALDTGDKKRQWDLFKEQSYAVYKMLVDQGNKFWLAHKVDKRGRMYSQGYHVNSQGTAFKKAMLELATEEIIEGVPDEHK